MEILVALPIWAFALGCFLLWKWMIWSMAGLTTLLAAVAIYDIQTSTAGTGLGIALGVFLISFIASLIAFAIGAGLNAILSRFW